MISSGGNALQLRRLHPLQEFTMPTLQRLCTCHASRIRSFFVGSEQAIDDLCLCLAHYVFAREAIRRGADVSVLQDAFRSRTYARAWSFPQMLAAVQSLRLCNVRSAHDRGSARMRCCAAGFLALLANEGHLPHMSMPAIVVAAMFGMVTGGLGMCRVVHSELASADLTSLPAWVASLWRARNIPFAFGVTAGRPRHEERLFEADALAAEVDAPAEAAQDDLLLEEDVPLPAQVDRRRCAEALRRQTRAACESLGLRLLQALGRGRTVQGSARISSLATSRPRRYGRISCGRMGVVAQEAYFSGPVRACRQLASPRAC